jgi:hypothetical protein
MEAIEKAGNKYPTDEDTNEAIPATALDGPSVKKDLQYSQSDPSCTDDEE